MPSKRIVAARLGRGRVGTIEQDVPALRPGAVGVRMQASLISPGTELGGWRGLAAEREQAGDSDEPREPKPFGYSGAGVVDALGEGVDRFEVGQRVACVGVGYALHTDYAVVPHHLCVALPEEADFAQGSYAMLGATALHALRRGRPEFGEFVGVLGLGIVGQLAAQLYHLAGCYVIGWDTITQRCETARSCGLARAVQVGQEEELAATEAFTRGAGLDQAVLAFGGRADETYQTVVKAMKCSPDGHPEGVLVVVGGCTFECNKGTITNMDIRRAGRTGPGYHDETWEHGADYPPVWLRWTTRTNLELILRLIAEGRLTVDALTTHRIPLAQAEEGIAAILDHPDDALGVVFTMGE